MPPLFLREPVWSSGQALFFIPVRDVYSHKDSGTNPAVFKAYIKSSAKKNSDAKMLLDVIKGINRGVIFNIHGTKSNADATVKFTAKEIQNLASE